MRKRTGSECHRAPGADQPMAMLGGRDRAPEANAEEVACVREHGLADRALPDSITGRENQGIEWAKCG